VKLEAEPSVYRLAVSPKTRPSSSDFETRQANHDLIHQKQRSTPK
jgi:hypothetical protein